MQNLQIIRAGKLYKLTTDNIETINILFNYNAIASYTELSDDTFEAITSRRRLARGIFAYELANMPEITGINLRCVRCQRRIRAAFKAAKFIKNHTIMLPPHIQKYESRVIRRIHLDNPIKITETFSAIRHRAYELANT